MISRFQFLIGKLRIIFVEKTGDTLSGFQFLIGKLRIKQNTPHKTPERKVSIPYR